MFKYKRSTKNDQTIIIEHQSGGIQESGHIDCILLDITLFKIYSPVTRNTIYKLTVIFIVYSNIRTNAVMSIRSKFNHEYR